MSISTRTAVIEPRSNGTALPYTIYDRLSEVDQGAIADNKLRYGKAHTGMLVMRH